MRTGLVFLLLASLTIPASAQDRRGSDLQPPTRYRLVGPTTFTNISGHPGTQVTDVDPQPDHSILSSIQFREESDAACGITPLFWGAPNGDRDAFDGWSELVSGLGCRGTNRSREQISASYPSPGVRTAIHGIQVCHNDRNENNIKLKGARVFVSVLSRDGDREIVRDAALADDFSRNHCRVWSQAQNCPAGQVAVGMRVHYRDNDARNNITGLALECQALEMSSALRRVGDR